MQPYYSLITNGGPLTCTSSFLDIPNLSFNLVAGATYRFRINYIWRSTATTGAILKPSLGGTVIPSRLFYTYDVQVSTSGVLGTRGSTSLNDDVVTNLGSAGQQNTDYGVLIRGQITVETTGTLTANALQKQGTAVIQSGGTFSLEEI